MPEKKVKKDKPASSKSKKSSVKSVEDSRYDELDKKWTDRFNRLEALMVKSLQLADQPTFSASVRVPPSHSPPAVISKDFEPFFQPLSSGRTGTDSSVFEHQSASQLGSESSIKRYYWKRHLYSAYVIQLVTDQQSVRSSPFPKHTGNHSSTKHQTASQLKQDRHRPRSTSPGCTGKDSSVSGHQSASQPDSDWNRPLHAGTDPFAHRHSSGSKVRPT